MLRTLKPAARARRCSASNCITCAPKPPMAPSSIVMSNSCSRASRRIELASSGLAKRASATVVEMPCAASVSAALMHSASRVPSDSSATVVPSRDDAAAADFERHADLRHLDADAVAARIAQRGRPVVDRGRGRHHVHEFGLVGRRHDDEIRQAAEISEIERAGMGRPVGADQAGAIHAEAHRQLLDRDVVHDLVVGALQERRIDRDKRLVALRRQASGKGHAVLLGDADVEGAIGKCLGENIDAGARRHRRGDGDDAVVLLRLLDQAFAEHLGVGRRVGGGLLLLAGRDVEFDDAMIFVLRGFGRRVAFALLRAHVHEDRSVVGVADIFENRQAADRDRGRRRCRRNRSRVPRTACRR